jgi:hypothetical protein
VRDRLWHHARATPQPTCAALEIGLGMFVILKGNVAVTGVNRPVNHLGSSSITDENSRFPLARSKF